MEKAFKQVALFQCAIVRNTKGNVLAVALGLDHVDSLSFMRGRGDLANKPRIGFGINGVLNRQREIRVSGVLQSRGCARVASAAGRTTLGARRVPDGLGAVD